MLALVCGPIYPELRISRGHYSQWPSGHWEGFGDRVPTHGIEWMGCNRNII